VWVASSRAVLAARVEVVELAEGAVTDDDR
jgi:hypothetical protein